MATSVRLNAKMATKFQNFMSEVVRALEDALGNLTHKRAHQKEF